jgi:hypothetical protein
MKVHRAAFALPALLAIALLTSGCIALITEATTGEGRHDPRTETGSDGGLEIIWLDGPASIIPGDLNTWRFRVHHNGASDAPGSMYSAICIPAWSYTLKDTTGRTIDMTGPLAYCMAYGEAFLAPGAHLDTEWSWDGTRYDAATDSTGPLESGKYTITVTFERLDQGPAGPSLTFVIDVA